MMVYTFCGLDLKACVKLVLCTHLVENLVVFLFTALSIYNINSLDLKEFVKYKAVLLYQVDFQNNLLGTAPGRRDQEALSLILIFPLVGVFISVLCLLFEKSKALKVIWLLHQGFSVLLLSTTFITSLTSYNLVKIDKVGLFLVFVPFIIFKFYSWLAIDASIKQIRHEEREEKFGAQWITNSLLYAPSNLRLSLPVVAPIVTVDSYERF